MFRTFQRFLVVLVLGCLILPASGAEEEEDEPGLKDRLFFGGNFGFSFGSTTSIIVSPLAGIYITPRLSSGLGIRYEYYKSNYPGIVAFDTHIYGGSVFTRYMIFKNMAETFGVGELGTGMFLQGEYEVLSLESRYFDHSYTDPGDRFLLHSVLAGGGIYQPIGKRAGLLLTVLWNLNESYRSIYSNPIIRLGFTF